LARGCRAGRASELDQADGRAGLRRTLPPMRKTSVGFLAVALLTFAPFSVGAATKYAKTKTAKATTSKFTPKDGEPIAHASSEERSGPDEIYPDVEKNPGAIDPEVTQDNIADNICNKAFKTSTIRPPSSYTTKLKKQQMADTYGDTVQQTTADLGGANYDEDQCVEHSDNTRCYEEDHIVSLQNGGAPSDARNLFPESYTTTVEGDRVGAREKDKVENFVHNGICLDVTNAKFSNGPKPKKALTLEDGQRILALDWYACYVSMVAGEDCTPPAK